MISENLQHGLQDLFNFGCPTETFQIKGVKFTLKVLDVQKLSDAVNSTKDALRYDVQKQILARAIIAINGESTFKNQDQPTAEEIKYIYENVLNKLNVVYIECLSSYYDILQKAIDEAVPDDIKKLWNSQEVK